MLTPPTYQTCGLQVTLPPEGGGNLILKPASRLDAFSVYQNRTRLPSYAPGGTTGAPPGSRTPDPLIKSQLRYELS